jgi:carbamate kinase
MTGKDGSMKKIVIALGGNAIKQWDQKGSAEEQFENVRASCSHIVRLIKKGFHVVVTHGNGPQVGNLLIQQEAGSKEVPPQPIDLCGAMTQGQIGYMLQNTLQTHLKAHGIDKDVVAIVNQVLVDPDDPEFFGDTASKPVGNFFTEEEAAALKDRLIASAREKLAVEEEEIRARAKKDAEAVRKKRLPERAAAAICKRLLGALHA